MLCVNIIAFKGNKLIQVHIGEIGISSNICISHIQQIVDVGLSC